MNRKNIQLKIEQEGERVKRTDGTNKTKTNTTGVYLVYECCYSYQI